MSNPSYKSTINDNIDACFKARIAKIKKEISEVKAHIASYDLDYERAISTDPAIKSNIGPEDLFSQYVACTTALRKANELLEDVMNAYSHWKSIEDNCEAEIIACDAEAR